MGGCIGVGPCGVVCARRVVRAGWCTQVLAGEAQAGEVRELVCAPFMVYRLIRASAVVVKGKRM